MAAHRYKLTYFNIRGKGEVARYLFALSGVSLEDHRIETDKWPEIKPTTPFGQLPLLDVDGELFCQSHGINRYLAREFGYYGADGLEGLQIDEILGVAADLQPKAGAITFFLQGEEKEKALQLLKDVEVPKMVKFLETKLGDRQWLVGDKVTLADIFMFEFLTATVTRLTGTSWRELSATVEALTKRVESLPALAAYVATRPVTHL